mgnify:CR=1 FL=1
MTASRVPAFQPTGSQPQAVAVAPVVADAAHAQDGEDLAHVLDLARLRVQQRLAPLGLVLRVAGAQPAQPEAAIDILETLDSTDECVVWAHRGHILFHSRDRIHAAFLQGGKTPPEVIAQAHTGNLFLKNQHFIPVFNGMLKSGAGV